MGARPGRPARLARVAPLIIAVLLLPTASPPAGAAPVAMSPPPLTCEAISNPAFPAAITLAPDGRIFYNELYQGSVRVISNASGFPETDPVPFVTLPDVNGTLEQGLLGLTTDPDWNTTPWLYVYYTAITPTGDENRIVRYWAAGPTAGVSEVVLSGLQSNISHNGGPMKFGPDRKLYVAVGEALQPNLSQSNTSLNGKVLRLEANGSIPTDNPDPASPIFAMGFRSIFGMAFNPISGELYITENGPNTNDEINLVRAGGNYGWPIALGFANDSRFIDPLWNTTPTTAPTGMVFDTSRFPLRDHIDLYFGEFKTGIVYRIELDAPNFDRIANITPALDMRSPVLALEPAPGGQIFITTVTTIFTFDPGRQTYLPPDAALNQTRTSTFPGKAVDFDATGSSDPDGDGLRTFLLDFGDGNASNGANQSHAWAQPGNYTVTGIVSDGCDYQTSVTRTVHVLDPATNRGPNATVSSSMGSTQVPARISLNAGASYDPEGGPLVFTWAWSDGVRTTGADGSRDITVAGNYSVKLTVQDELGARATTDYNFHLDPHGLPPVASGSAVPSEAVLLDPVTFDASASHDPDGSIVAYHWQFGDGEAAEGPVVTHVYHRAGAHNVTLTVTDNDGWNSTSSFEVHAVARPVPPPSPVAAVMAFAVAGALVLRTAVRRRRR